MGKIVSENLEMILSKCEGFSLNSVSDGLFSSQFSMSLRLDTAVFLGRGRGPPTKKYVRL